jgi:hypothetical protein
VVAAPAWGQRVPLSRGDHIRVTNPDSPAGRWLEGHVLQASRIGVLLAPLHAAHDSVAVPLISPVRLQVPRRSALTVLLGTAIGSILGGVAGALIPEGALWSDGRPGHAGEVVMGAFGGAALGWVATWVLGSKRWEDIPLSDRGFAVAPLSRTPRRRAHIGHVERWRAFSPTEQDFAAFFWAHRDSLQPIEGIWRMQPRAGQTGVDARVAIVRDTRYEGWAYVAIVLPSKLRYYSAVDGTVLFVARHAEQPGAYEVRSVDSPGPSSLALLRDNVLRVRYADTAVEWWKEPETPQ